MKDLNSDIVSASGVDSDIKILMDSYNKYKDKNGMKARSLMVKIEAYQAMGKLIESINS